MTPFMFFAVVIVEVLLTIAFFNVPLVVQVVTSSSYTMDTVVSSVIAILAIFDTGLLIFGVRSR